MSSKVVRAEGSGCNKGTFMISLGFRGGEGRLYILYMCNGTVANNTGNRSGFHIWDPKA